MNVLEMSVKAALIVGLAAIAAAILRNRSAAAENAVWRICLVAVVTLPLWAVASQLWPAREPVTPAERPGIQVHIAPVVPRLAVSVATLPAVNQVPPESPEGRDWLPILGILGALFFLGRIGLGTLQVGRMIREAEPVGAEGRAIVRRSSRIEVPATFGALRPIILMPLAAADWPEEQRRVAILHETAHIRRHDWAWQMFGQMIAAVSWFNPAIWFALVALRNSAERATDDAVVSAGVGPYAYAAQLLEIAKNLPSKQLIGASK